MIPRWLMPKNSLDVLHYIIVFAVVAYAFIMPFGIGLIVPFGAFYLSDKVAHKVLGVD